MCRLSVIPVLVAAAFAAGVMVAPSPTTANAFGSARVSTGGGVSVGVRVGTGGAAAGVRRGRPNRPKIGKPRTRSTGIFTRERPRRRRGRPFVGGFLFPFGVDRGRRRNDVTIVNVNNPPPPAPVEITPMTPAEPRRVRAGAAAFETRAQITLEARGETLEAAARALADKRARLDGAMALGGLETCAIGAPSLAIMRSGTEVDPSAFLGTSAFTLGVDDGPALLGVIAALDPDTVSGLVLSDNAPTSGAALDEGAAQAEEDAVRVAGPVRRFIPPVASSDCD
ncbi:MAG: hypothetical protein AAFT19_04945 [Pseudomonadota bacterium]